MTKILKNTTGSDVNILSLGRRVPASGQITVPEQDYLLLASSDVVTELTPLINAGTVVVNDGIDDLTAARGIDYISHPHQAFNIRFAASPQRSNGFVKKNVQEAIEEVQLIAEPLIVPIILVHNGRLSNNEFIGYSNLLPGDDTPIIAPITGNFVGFTWSNDDAGADFALEFRKNTTGGAAFFTWSVDNTQTADVTLGTPQPFTAGDRIYVKYIDEGNNASDAAIVLKFKA